MCTLVNYFDIDINVNFEMFMLYLIFVSKAYDICHHCICTVYDQSLH